MQDILEHLWYIAQRECYPIHSEDNKVMNLSIGLKDLKEGLYLFTENPNTNEWSVTKQHPTSLLIQAERLERDYKFSYKEVRDHSLDVSINVDGTDNVIAKAIAEYMRLRRQNIADFDIEIKLKSKKMKTLTTRVFSGDNIRNVTKPCKFVQDESGSTEQVYADINSFPGVILRTNKAKEFYILDVATMFDKGHITVDEVVAIFKSLVVPIVDYMPRPNAFIHTDNKEGVKAQEQHVEAGKMRSLIRALDLHTDGGISITQPDSVAEESIMISKLVRLARQSGNPANSYNEVVHQLEMLYAADSIDHILKTTGDTICIRGVLYAKLSDNYFWELARVRNNGKGVSYSEPTLINGLLTEYSSNAVDEYLARWINVNDLVNRY